MHPSKLDQPKLNFLAIAISSIAMWGIYINADVLKDAGMAAIILNWVPLIMGVVTMIIYGLSRFITKKRNWIISALGIGFTLIYVVMAFLD